MTLTTPRSAGIRRAIEAAQALMAEHGHKLAYILSDIDRPNYVISLYAQVDQAVIYAVNDAGRMIGIHNALGCDAAIEAMLRVELPELLP